MRCSLGRSPAHVVDFLRRRTLTHSAHFLTECRTPSSGLVPWRAACSVAKASCVVHRGVALALRDVVAMVVFSAAPWTVMGPAVHYATWVIVWIVVGFGKALAALCGVGFVTDFVVLWVVHSGRRWPSGSLCLRPRLPWPWCTCVGEGRVGRTEGRLGLGSLCGGDGRLDRGGFCAGGGRLVRGGR